jgi:hypothetical protein
MSALGYKRIFPLSCWWAREKYDNVFLSMVYVSGEGKSGALNVHGSFQHHPSPLPSMPAVAGGPASDLAAKLRALAERVRRNVRLRPDPERFHIEKSCICQDLEHIASMFVEKQERRGGLTINRQRRAITAHSAAQNFFK